MAGGGKSLWETGYGEDDWGSLLSKVLNVALELGPFPIEEESLAWF